MMPDRHWFDLYDPRLKTDPRPIYERLLREEPFITEIDGAEAAVFSRYKHVEDIYGNYQLFSSVKPQGAVKKVDYFAGDLNIAFSDPPQHTRLRRSVQPAFMPASIAGLAPAVERAAAEIFDQMEGGHIDVMKALARPLAQRVMLREVLGIPEQDHHIFVDLAKAIFHPGGRAPGSPEALAFERLRAVAKDYSRQLVAAERESPRNAVLGAIVSRGGENGLISDDEVLALLTNLLTGGFSTIASLVGNAFLALAGRPDQLRLLRDDPDLLVNAVEEVARHRAPGLFNYRFPLQDCDFAGLRLNAGAPVYMLQGATSFDPDYFDDPFLFDIRRTPKRLLVFGHGIHHCIGAPVARLTTRMALREALQRFGQIELAVPVDTIEYTSATQELTPIAVPLRLAEAR